jgi:hypothetical protein
MCPMEITQEVDVYGYYMCEGSGQGEEDVRTCRQAAGHAAHEAGRHSLFLNSWIK